MGRLFCIVLVYELLLATTASGHSSGPPVKDNFSLCENLTPRLSAHGSPQAGDGGYLVSIDPPMDKSAEGFVYSPGRVYSMSLVGTTHTFKGFLLQARDPVAPPPSLPMLLGRFESGSDDQKTLDCDPVGVALEACIGHSSAVVRSVAQFKWIAPDSNGKVDFLYTVMRVNTTHFDQLSAWKLGPPLQSESFAVQADNRPLGSAIPPKKSPEDYRIQFHTPKGCNGTDCSLYVAIDTNEGNDSYLDIYLDGQAAGWVGIGFSDTANMFSADVVACNRLNDQIVCLDLWNVAPPGRSCPTDVIQDVYLFESSYTNGRLSCKVIKRILPSDEFDIDLNQDLFALYGKRSSNSTTLLEIGPHDFDHLPAISSKKINVAKDGGSSGGSGFDLIRKRLIKAHGILMIVAWPILGVTGIFFPLLMRRALPNGQWFQIHRVFMLVSTLLVSVGFILIFVAQLHQPTPGLIPLGPSEPLGTSHFIVGVTVVTFQLLNPLISLLRCKPNSKNRWIFNLIHGRIIGFSTGLFALINIGIGLSLFDPSHLILWVYLSWDGVYICSVVVLFILFTVLAVTSTDEDCKSLAPTPVQGLIKVPKGTKDTDRMKWSASSGVKIPDQSISVSAPLLQKTDEKLSPSKDAPLRWAGLGLFVSISVPLSISVIVLVSIHTYVL